MSFVSIIQLILAALVVVIPFLESKFWRKKQPPRYVIAIIGIILIVSVIVNSILEQRALAEMKEDIYRANTPLYANDMQFELNIRAIFCRDSIELSDSIARELVADTCFWEINPLLETDANFERLYHELADIRSFFLFLVPKLQVKHEWEMSVTMEDGREVGVIDLQHIKKIRQEREELLLPWLECLIHLDSTHIADVQKVLKGYLTDRWDSVYYYQSAWGIGGGGQMLGFTFQMFYPSEHHLPPSLFDLDKCSVIGFMQIVHQKSVRFDIHRMRLSHKKGGYFDFWLIKDTTITVAENAVTSMLLLSEEPSQPFCLYSQ